MKTEPEGEDARYAVLVPVEVRVYDEGVQEVTVAATVDCAVGGSSLPVEVSVELAPFNDVTVTLTASEAVTDEETGEVTPSVSEGLTAPEDVVTLDVYNTEQLLTVACADTMEVSETATLDWTLGGTDVANFELSSALLTVTAVEAVVLSEDEEYVVTVEKVDSESSSSETVVAVTCPNAG